MTSISQRDSLGRMVGRPFEDRLKLQLQRVVIKDTCMLWQGARAGSGLYPVIRDANNVQKRVSHVMLERAGHPRPSPSHLACHTCDDPQCVNPEHLFWGTAKENSMDASRKGRSNKPTGEHLAKIKDAINKRWADPEFKAERLRKLAECATTPEFRLAVKAGIHAAKFRDPIDA